MQYRNTVNLKDVLAWVNQERKYVGLPKLAQLPEGKPQDCEQCVIAQCFPMGFADVDFVQFSAGVWDKELTLPDHVRRFITAFDNGEFPELVAP